MQPKYFKLLGFDRERTAFAGKYGLLLFRDQYDYKLPVPSSMLAEYSNSVYTVDKEAKVCGRTQLHRNDIYAQFSTSERKVKVFQQLNAIFAL
jgi:hypothetical protein